ncbi:MAG: putative maltokinase, partial [Dehalococcoidia bacterium]|nr:putative maltokinase [Dehalococcoidia bacterium]
FLRPENRKILAFLRQYQGETILVIANLSHLAQQTQLDLSKFTGWRPVDLFGGVEFAPITDGKYYFTLSPYAFYWFSLEPQPVEALRLRVLPSEEVRVVPSITKDREELFEKRNWSVLAAVLEDYMSGRRWFRGKARDIRSSQITEVIPMRFPESTAYMVFMQVSYTEGEPETYVLPLTTAPADHIARLVEQYPHAVVIHLTPHNQDSDWLLYDALFDKEFCQSLLQAIERGRRFKGAAGELLASPTRAFRGSISGDVSLEPTPVKAEQTNTSVIYGDRLILKLFRRLEGGINPELEIGRFLTEKASFAHISPLAGALEYRRGKSQPMSLAVLQAFVPNEGDAWQYTLDSLEYYLKNVLAHPTVQVPPVPQKHLLSLLKEPPPLARETIGPYLTSAQLLGQRTAELHLALSSAPDDPDFAPEPFTFMYQTSIYQSMRGLTIQKLQLLRDQLNNLPNELREDAEQVLDLEKTIIERYQLVRKQKISAARIRCHGDYHLGQVLYTGKDFVIIDFEGEPARPLSERRLKRSPVQDVAGMLRSFHYAAHSAVRRQLTLTPRPEDDLPILQHWVQYWYVWVSVAFLTSYLEVVKQAHLLPEELQQLRILLDAYLLEKAVYEVGYELNNRPDWVKVPLQGILQLMEASL